MENWNLKVVLILVCHAILAVKDTKEPKVVLGFDYLHL
jgi:hypothetical protein